MQTIEQTYELEARPTTAFAYLTDVDKLTTWWITGGASENRVGGAYRFRFDVTEDAKAEGKEDHVQQGTYSVFEPGKALAYNWDCGTDSQVHFGFAASKAGTKLTLRHTGIPDDDQLYGMLAGGWEFFLGNLQSMLAGGDDQRAAFGLKVPVTA